MPLTTQAILRYLLLVLDSTLSFLVHVSTSRCILYLVSPRLSSSLTYRTTTCQTLYTIRYPPLPIFLLCSDQPNYSSTMSSSDPSMTEEKPPSGDRWPFRRFFGRGSSANDSDDDNPRTSKWSMGVLNDPKTVEVPGKTTHEPFQTCSWLQPLTHLF